MDKLAQGVITVLRSRYQELEECMDKVIEEETRSLSKEDFEANLSECMDYQKGIEVFIRAVGPLSTDTDKSLELLKLQVCFSHVCLVEVITTFFHLPFLFMLTFSW